MKMGDSEHVSIFSDPHPTPSSENQKPVYNSIGIQALTDMRLFIIFIPLSETV